MLITKGFASEALWDCIKRDITENETGFQYNEFMYRGLNDEILLVLDQITDRKNEN